MTPLLLRLAAKLLELASDKYCNHGCNDLDLVDDLGLTSEEAYQVNKVFAEWDKKQNGDDAHCPSEDELNCYYSVGSDWELMKYAADVLLKSDTVQVINIVKGKGLPMPYDQDPVSEVYEFDQITDTGLIKHMKMLIPNERKPIDYLD